MFNHYVNYCQTTILHLQREMDGLRHELASHSNPAYLENLLRGMGQIAQQWQAELDWAGSIREQELRQTDSAHPHMSADAISLSS